jgi:hypothetical protein
MEDPTQNNLDQAKTPLEDLPAPSLDDLPSALERLGPSPFPKSGFPLLGFLATLYDQVAGPAEPES